MLNENDLAAWYQRLNFSEPARTVIDRVRCSDPARRVGGGRSNVSWLYPSRKMGVTIQFESHRVELAAIFEMEHDPQILEFYDRPGRLRWITTAQTGSARLFATRQTFSSSARTLLNGGVEDTRRTEQARGSQP